jgi:hypothetical protein
MESMHLKIAITQWKLCDLMCGWHAITHHASRKPTVI